MIPELGLTVYLITLAQSGSPVLSQYAAETVGDSDRWTSECDNGLSK